MSLTQGALSQHSKICHARFGKKVSKKKSAKRKRKRAVIRNEVPKKHVKLSGGRVPAAENAEGEEKEEGEEEEEEEGEDESDSEDEGESEFEFGDDGSESEPIVHDGEESAAAESAAEPAVEEPVEDWAVTVQKVRDFCWNQHVEAGAHLFLVCGDCGQLRGPTPKELVSYKGKAKRSQGHAYSRTQLSFYCRDFEVLGRPLNCNDDLSPEAKQFISANPLK